MNYHESTKPKRLKIQIRDSTELSTLIVDGLSIIKWIDTGDQYEFKVEDKRDFLSPADSYLLRLSKNPTPKHEYVLEILDSGYWHSTGLLLTIGEIKIRRLFYKRCIELITELENYKKQIV